jgi:hypothetical protein
MIAGPLLFLVLLAIAALHLAWARGVVWPAQDEPGLVAMVIGMEGIGRLPPKKLTYLVAVTLAFGAVTALLLAFDVVLPGNALGYVGAGFAAVFVLRGVLGYLPPWRKRHPLEPFATLDRIIYSPACILLGEGFFSLVSSRF